MSGLDSRDAFLADVREGLGTKPKSLPSKYFYDAEGDRLFQKIMASDAYYPSSAEERILREQGREILQVLIPEDEESFNLVELGAGDGSKTRHLLDAVPKEKRQRVRYIPNDISENVLKELESSLVASFEDLSIELLPGDHVELLPSLSDRWEGRKAILFLGGNLGNYSEQGRKEFLHLIGDALNPGDRLLIGLDKRKDPRRIHRAYDDEEGVTAAFNRNLLERMNRELGADFVPESFLHYPFYDPQEGEARSYLVSMREQMVRIEEADMDVPFDAWESIFLERSKKFSSNEVEALAQASGFRVERDFEDPNGDFLDSVWVKI